MRIGIEAKYFIRINHYEKDTPRYLRKIDGEVFESENKVSQKKKMKKNKIVVLIKN